jgi:Cu(I)/Ag(I) efflux system membrane fusion protein
MPVELTLPYWPDKKFAGKVTFVSPTLDPESRTLKARLEVSNPEMLLKSEMFGTANLSYELGEKLAIPEAAVMRNAQQTYAFHDTGNGRLVPTPITVGARNDGYYELLSGLNEGDKVVTSANFLVDSESSMKAALQEMGHESGERKAESTAEHRH